MRILLIAILLSGCSYNGYNDPNILWPTTWHVDDHAEKLNIRQVNWCGVYS